MKKLMMAMIVGTVAFVVWRLLANAHDQSSALDRLRTSIDASTLPGRARQEMLTLLDERRLRPSQYLDASD